MQFMFLDSVMVEQVWMARILPHPEFTPSRRENHIEEVPNTTRIKEG